MKTNLLIVSDLKILGEGIANVLKKKNNDAKIYNFDRVENVLKANINNIDVDFIILDIDSITKKNIIADVFELKQKYINSKIILLGEHCNPNILEECLSNGVSGFICKKDHINDIIKAIREISKNKIYLSKSIKLHIKRINNSGIYEHPIGKKLSEKQIEVVMHILKNMKSNEISKIMGLSKRTIDVHIYNIYKLLNIKKREDLIKLFKKYQTL